MFHPFQVEQFLSEREQRAEFNFSESGVHPMTLGELMALAGLERGAIEETLLDYPEVNGFRSLREKIAALYDGVDPDQVLVTVGASEANQIVASALLKPGDKAIAFRPTYQQLPGNALNAGIEVETVALREERDWALDLEELEDKAGDDTRLIHVVNPNNPTGHILEESEVAGILAVAERTGAWIVADEVYAGTERERNRETPSFWGRADRVIAINSMSKAYGLPGLRLGWAVAPAEIAGDLWRRHEYATISATMLANRLADAVLAPEVRPKVIARSRALIRRGFDQLRDALAEQDGVFSVVAPQASAMSFVNYDLPIGSVALAERLLRDQGTLVIPGACFGLENHLRISSALPEATLRDGLARLNSLVAEIRKGR